MLKLLSKIFPVLFIWGIFILAIFQIPYPENLTRANILQILGFFIPLFLAVSLTINIFLRNIFLSSSISVGIILSLLLKALDSLNLVTGTIIITAIVLLVSYFRKINRGSVLLRKIKKRSLTLGSKIPKLHAMRKQ